MKQLFLLAYRDLVRNKRRSLLSSLALGMGLALLLLMAAVVRGEMQGSIDQTIRLQSGHIQIRAESFSDDKNSLAWEDLIEDPDKLSAIIQSQPEVVLVTPRILASGIINTVDESISVKLMGVDPTSTANAPFYEGMIEGSFIQEDDREGFIIGKDLASKYHLKTGDQVQLLANTANGDVNEQSFTIRGVFSTKTPAFDQFTILMPISKAQAMTGTENHASLLFVMLKNKELTDSFRERIQTEKYQVKTWLDLNQFTVAYEDMANAYMYILYLIVLGVTATVIVNTLVMSVFERTREIGILSAVGMRSTKIMVMFLIESAILAIMGIVMGMGLGGLLVWYATKIGFYIGNMGITGMMLGERIYASLILSDAIPLILVALAVTLVASLYPAILAARLEPVEALHGGKVA